MYAHRQGGVGAWRRNAKAQVDEHRVAALPACSGRSGAGPFLQAVELGWSWTRSRAADGPPLTLSRPEGTAQVGRFLRSLSAETLECRFGRASVNEIDIGRFIRVPTVKSIMAFVEGRPVALADLNDLGQEDGIPSFGLGVVVHQDHQGAGIGRILVCQMIDIARLLGYRRGIEVVLRGNKRGLALAQAFGFTERRFDEDPWTYRQITRPFAADQSLYLTAVEVSSMRPPAEYRSQVLSEASRPAYDSAHRSGPRG